MKKLLPAIIGLLLFSTVSAQKQTVVFNASYFRFQEENNIETGLGYFKQVGKKRWVGAKFYFGSNTLGLSEKDIRSYLFIPNVANRWQLVNRKHFRLFAELGVSALIQVDRQPAYSSFIEDFFLSPEELERWLEYQSHWHTETEINFAPNGCLDADFPINRHWSMGLYLPVYYILSEDFGPLAGYPYLQLAYTFGHEKEK